MAAINVGNAISPAIEHTKRLLFRPFALRKWMALGLVSLLMGAGQGNAHFNLPSDNAKAPGECLHIALGWVTHHMALVIALSVLLIAVSLALSWLRSVIRFVYLNQITRDPYAIREPFSRYIGLGTSFFLWNLALGFIVLLLLGILLGIPISVLIKQHGTSSPAAILPVLIWSILAILAVMIPASIVIVFADDLVTAAMFARGTKVIDGWRAIIPILASNAGQAALYVLLIIAFGIGMAIAGMIIVLAVGLVFAIIAGLFALIGYGMYTASGHTWSTPLIVYSAIIGSLVLLAFAYVTNCAMQPLIVFRRTFPLVVLGQADPSMATVQTGQTPISP